MSEVIYQTAKKVNFCSEGIIVWKFAQLNTIGVVNYHDFLLNIRFHQQFNIFCQKIKGSRKFRRNIFALLLHNTVTSGLALSTHSRQPAQHNQFQYDCCCRKFGGEKAPY